MARRFVPSKKLTNMKQVITFLEMKGLDTLPWRISAAEDSVKLEIRRNEIPDGTQANDPGPSDLDDQDLDGPEAGGNIWRTCKQVFGPLKIKDSYGGEAKILYGKRVLDEELTINVEFSRTMVCKPMEREEIENLTERERDEIFERAAAGEITIPKCREITHGQNDY